ncbi:MAG TPA: metallophosphoesterase family protein [Bacteroidia bacterium]
MNLFVVGDIHGCYKTFKNLLKQWDRESELLLQVGDIIDRGNHTPETVKLCRELQKEYGAVFIKGNHEQIALDYFLHKKEEKWFKKYYRTIHWQYTFANRDFEDDMRWINSLPVSWENDYILLSHAGISNSPFAMDERHMDGLTWNRGPIKNIGRLQIYGHTPLKSGKPEYYAESNSWNIDTGVYLKRNLAALRLRPNGELIEVITVSTVGVDVN